MNTLTLHLLPMLRGTIDLPRYKSIKITSNWSSFLNILS